MSQDYILLKMEDFAKTMANVAELKREGKWDQAINIIGESLYRLLGTVARDPREFSKLTETGLLAQLIKNGYPATVWLPYKKIMLIALLKEAGDYATFRFPQGGGRGWYLKALHLLLDALAHDELRGQSELVPPVEALLIVLSDSPLPIRTRLLLILEYERRGQLASVRNEFQAALEIMPQSLKLVDFGIALFERMNYEEDGTLAAAGLSRSEIVGLLSKLISHKSLLLFAPQKKSTDGI